MTHSRAARRRTALLSHFLADPDELAAACAARDRWLQHGLCTDPADRPAAEHAVRELYRLVGAAPPIFLWVPSPGAALEMARRAGVEAWSPRAEEPPPAQGRIARLLTDARKRMSARALHSDVGTRQQYQLARLQTPGEALAAGIPAARIAQAAVEDSLRASLFDGVARTIRTLLPPVHHRLGPAWYGQQEAHRVALLDLYRRRYRRMFLPGDRALLALQADLVESTGWWWPFDRVCVMAERPIALHTELTPSGSHNERRLHHRDRPAVEFVDGSAVFVLHGTVVPDWVIRDPTAERIAGERNIEVRRSAIERLGWDTYLEMADLALLGEADDPGNPGAVLRLYDSPLGSGTRVLLAVNGSVERDGTRRRYGLSVPATIDNPLDAAAWTYGLRGTDYARLVRRT